MKRTATPTFLWALAAFCLLLGCAGRQPETDETARSSTGFMDLDEFYASKEWVRLLGPVEERSRVIARVNGEPLKREDLDSLLVKVLLRRQEEGLSMEPKEIQKVRARTLDALVNLTLEKQEAVQQALKIDWDKVDARYNKYREMYGGEEEWTRELAKHGETPATFREICANEVRVKALQEKVTGDPEPTEEEIVAQWKALEDNFVNVFASQIFFSIPEDASAVEAERKRALAERVLGRIEPDGGNFGALAREFSEHRPTAEVDGRMGGATLSAIQPEIADLLRGRPKGWVSDIVEVDGGLTIFMVTGWKRLTLSDIRKNVVDLLKEKKGQQKYDAFLRDVRKESDVRILDEGLSRTLTELAAGESR